MEKIVFGDHAEFANLLQLDTGQGSGSVRLEVQPLRGGLESAGVLRITAYVEDPGAPKRSRCMVVKRLQGSSSREARIYQEILGSAMPGFSPALLGVRQAPGESRLYLEAIRPIMRWPWRTTAWSADVLRSLARLHMIPVERAAAWDWLAEWDYESDLGQRAEETVAFVEQWRGEEGAAVVRTSLPILRRLASALPELRRQLFEFAPFGRTFIHGDVHPGNVFIRKTRSGVAPVLLDWGRSRMGSPLEDAASWLQSLGFWEPDARRRHDTLLAGYLAARGLRPRLTRELRDAYWLAAASNLFAGALLYHGSIAAEPRGISSKKRSAALHALSDCLRVLRRADACWK